MVGFEPLKDCGYYTYHLIQHYKILRFIFKIYLFRWILTTGKYFLELFQ
jgi:hypothetical protein